MEKKLLRTDYSRHEKIYARDQTAPGWNSPAVDAEILAYVDELLHFANMKPPARILELGCGMGNLSIPLARLGFRVEGVDISPTAIEVASSRATYFSVAATFWAEDITKIKPAATRRYAAILDGLCWHCIIGNDRRTLLRSIAELLAPGGVFLVITMCGMPRLGRIVARFDTDTNCLTDGTVAERYIGSIDTLLEELRSASFHVRYHRLVRGDENTGNEDLLLAVAQIDE